MLSSGALRSHSPASPSCPRARGLPPELEWSGPLLSPHLPVLSIEFPVGLRALYISLYPSTKVVRPLPPLFSRPTTAGVGVVSLEGVEVRVGGVTVGVVEGVMGVEAGWRRGKWSNQYTR
ncbi:unnamed protein product [Arctogadus glacialis]